MELLVDREITGADTAFQGFGEVRLFAGRELTAETLGAAEVLLVRSVTRVDRALLAGSQVRFVGTATAGTDHIDLDYLAAAGIAFADVPGCNARAVAEHVVCCLYRYAARHARSLAALTVGIIGYGHVGRALAALLQVLGVTVLANDPPLAARDSGFVSASLHDVLACDAVSVHVPLAATGPYPTRHLLDAAALARMTPGSLLVNAARGGVVDEAALVARLTGPEALLAAIDCWEGEPRIAARLLEQAWLATPHIAGHTREARAAASRGLHDALARWCGSEPVPAPALLPPGRRRLAPDSLLAALASVHDLDLHTTRLRALVGLDAAARGAAFDALRREHGLRREFAHHDVACAGMDADTVAALAGLGFTCDSPRSAAVT